MKKVLALVLAVVLAFGMTTVAFAATDRLQPVGGGEKYLSLGESVVYYAGDGDIILGDGRSATSSNNDEVDANNLTARADAQIRMDLRAVLASIPGNTYTVNQSSLDNDKYKVRWSFSKGSAAIRDIGFYTTGGVTYVRVRFVKEYVNVNDLDFDFEVWLTKNGKKLGDTIATFTGTLKNEKEYVSEGDEYVDLSSGIIVEAEDYIKSIEVDGGNGVSLWTKMFEDKKYYFTTSVDVKDEDAEVLAKYPEIAMVYYLNQAGFSPLTGNIVSFDIDEKYYVYNVDGQYVGLTTEKLPFSKKYYLAEKQIDMGGTDATEEPGEAPASETPENPDMGGDDGAPNANDNPGTGANGLVSVAVVAGMVALAAAGAVSKKR